MLSAIEARLRALNDPQGRPLLQQVDTALALADIKNRPVRSRSCAFVVPLSDRPVGNSRDIGPPMQQVDHSVGVVLVLKDLSSQQLDGLRQQVRQALFGWQPLPECDPMLLGNSDLYAITDGQLWWLDRFTTSRYLEASHG